VNVTLTADQLIIKINDRLAAKSIDEMPRTTVYDAASAVVEAMKKV
jgi:hypothetical protein